MHGPGVRGWGQLGTWPESNVDGGHVGISRAQREIFRAAEAGRPGHRQRHKHTRDTFTTRIYTH
eukprot:2279814-Prymnesium_polylepis.1